MKTINSLFKKEILWLFPILMCFLATTNGKAQINCTFVENYGNASKAQILEQINNSVAGLEYKVGVTNLKKLKIKEAKNIAFDGCKVTLELRVTLKRKVRRDAKGTIFVTGTIHKAQFYGLKHIMVKNAKVDQIRLSRTLRIGEKFYKWAANRTFPKNQRFYL